MPEDKTKSKMPITAWLWIGLFGIVLITISSLIKVPEWLLKIILGLGTSLLTAAVFKHGIDFVDVLREKKWLRNHIEIIAPKRTDEKAQKIYGTENKNIEKSLYILSFSAFQVFKQLRTNKILCFLLANKQVDIRILVADWRSKAAAQRAGEDNPGAIDTGMDAIKNQFKYIEEVYNELYEYLNNIKNKETIGKIEVRATKNNPYLTLYIKDEETLIFGHYFSYCRGEDNAALMIKKTWNVDIFNQYMSHFSKLWNQEGKNWVFYIRPKKGFTGIDKDIKQAYFKKLKRPGD